MADFIQFTGPVKPLGASTFAILEDIFLQGSYRVLETEAEKDSIDVTTCKEGMLVRCLDTKKNYTLSKLTVGEDEFGDPIATKEWTEFSMSVPNTAGSTVKALSRWQLSIKSSVLAPNAEFTIKLPFAKAIILERLEVDKLCKVEFKETKNDIILGDYATFNNVIDHEFTDTSKLVYSNQFVFPDGTPLMTRYTQIFMNKDPVLDKYYYYKVVNTTADTVAILTKFFVVGIHN